MITYHEFIMVVDTLLRLSVSTSGLVEITGANRPTDWLQDAKERGLSVPRYLHEYTHLLLNLGDLIGPRAVSGRTY